MASSRLYMPLARAVPRRSIPRTAQIASRLLKNRPARYYSSKKGSEEKFVIWRPWLRLSIGIPFIGALIYSMVTENVAQTEAPTIAEIDQALKDKSPVNDDSPMRLRMEKLIKDHQKKITDALSRIDGKAFVADEWTRPNGGGGISCVLQDGNVFEKAGVNVSVVYGELPRPAIEKMRADHKSFVGANVDSLSFFAAGLSLVLHPHNPNAPTVHLNYRYFETSDPKDPINGDRNWWFGGGTDLTPSYLFPEDCKHFHQTIKEVCDRHNSTYYPRFKAWCDKYFYIQHRGEARGIGGIFFDDLDANFLQSSSSSSQNPQETLFSFVSDALASFLPSYVPILERRKDMPYTEKQKQWQQLRRGRYVEFNLVYDRGTSFGLRTPNARVESILMSLPRTASWVYMDPVSGTRTESAKSEDADNAVGEDADNAVGEDAEEISKQRELLEVLKNPRQWV